MEDKLVSVAVDLELRSHFIATYASESQARVSWSFIREHAPQQSP
jgi:hypothetical protein